MRFFKMEHAAVAIDVEAKFAGFSVNRAQTSTAIGTDFTAESPAFIAVAVSDNLDTAMCRRHKATSSQTSEHESQP